MYILLNKNTGVIEDIVSKPFETTSDFEFIFDAQVTSAEVKKIYNKQTKVVSEPAPREQPRDLASEKIATLETRLQELETKGTKEPILGVGEIQAQDQSFNPLYLLLIPVVVGAYFLGKKL